MKASTKRVAMSNKYAADNEYKAAEFCEDFAVTATKSQANGSSITVDFTGQGG